MNKNLADKINWDSSVENFVSRQTKHSVAILYHTLSVTLKKYRLITDTICSSYKNEGEESGKYWAGNSPVQNDLNHLKRVLQTNSPSQFGQIVISYT